jgi:hypothetical protein
MVARAGAVGYGGMAGGGQVTSVDDGVLTDGGTDVGTDEGTTDEGTTDVGGEGGGDAWCGVVVVPLDGGAPSFGCGSSPYKRAIADNSWDAEGGDRLPEAAVVVLVVVVLVVAVVVLVAVAVLMGGGGDGIEGNLIGCWEEASAAAAGEAGRGRDGSMDGGEGAAAAGTGDGTGAGAGVVDNMGGGGRTKDGLVVAAIAVDETGADEDGGAADFLDGA